MTHDELLNVLWYGFKHTNDALDDVLEDKGDAKELQHQLWTYKALRAVVELHKPWTSVEKDNYFWGFLVPHGRQICPVCGPPAYPCPTIQAIEKELK